MAVTSVGTLIMAAMAGFGLGFAHGLETDHLTEIATQVIRRGGNGLRAFVIGSAFGMGHMITILLLGGVSLALHISVSDRFTNLMDGLAGLLIIWLGASTLLLAVRPLLHTSRPTVGILANIYRFLDKVRMGGWHLHFAKERGWYLHQHGKLTAWENPNKWQGELFENAEIPPSGRRKTWKEQLRGMRQQMMLGGIFALNPPPEAIAIFMIMIPATSLRHSFGIGGWWNGLVVILFFGVGIAVSMGLWGLLVSGVFNLSRTQNLSLVRWTAGSAGVAVILLGVLFSCRAAGIDVVPNMDDTLQISKRLHGFLSRW